MKSRLFRMAWAIRNQFNSFSEALKHSWNVVRLQFRLCTEAIVNFKYKKIDGTIREAIGSNENLPYVKTGERKVNYGVLTYFDIEANGFRSCQIQNLIF